MSTPTFENPSRDCPLCPRLNAFIAENRAVHPDWWNAPVPSFGPLDASILVLGLAPGLQGANRTGRPFTGDWAGDLLYKVLVEEGLADGVYDRRPDDGLRLTGCRIANAVRCVPPQNKPVGTEITACRPFLIDEIAAMTKLQIILALGSIAHNSVLRTLGLKQSAFKFFHAAEHDLSNGPLLVDSYHCSRYNTNTRRLTPEMFHDVFRLIRRRLD